MKLLNYLFLTMTLFAFTAIAHADTIEVTNVSGIWTNPVGGQDLSGVGTSQIFWGGTSTTGSGFSFVGDAPPTLFPVVDTPFALGTFTYYDRPISPGSAITSVQLDTTVSLLIGGVTESLPFVYNFNSQTVVNNVPMASTFTVNGEQYTVELLGFLQSCTMVNTAILEAVITSEVAVPEPSTYLLMGSTLALALFLKKTRLSKSTV